MIFATQIYSHNFDAAFFKLPNGIQSRIEERIDRLGANLRGFPHHRLTGDPACRLRIGDYRVIYEFSIPEGKLYLLEVGHRREIYR